MGRPKKATSSLTVRFPDEEIERMKQWQRMMGVNTQQVLHWAYYCFKAGVMTPMNEPVKICPQMSALRHVVQNTPQNYEI